jgi:hypothetical protein
MTEEDLSSTSLSSPILLLGALIVLYILYKVVLCILCPFQQRTGVPQGQTSIYATKKNEGEQIEEVALSQEMKKLQGRLFPAAAKTAFQRSTQPNLTISIDKAFIDRNSDHGVMCHLDTTAEQLSEIAAVYMLIHAGSDEEQERILEDMKSYYVPSFKQYHRILFYGSEIGKIAMLRQLKPKIHVEPDINTFTAIKPHLEHAILLDYVGNSRGGNFSTGKEVGKYEDILYLDFR